MAFASHSVAILAMEYPSNQGSQVLLVLMGAGLALLVIAVCDIASRWRVRHPRRRPPSRRDWARIREAECRSRATGSWTVDRSVLTGGVPQRAAAVASEAVVL
ncbi:hypothetical protein UA75_21455 [Actinoalloteichus sp. GBA129-24]|uniref:Uncharacterized protein n=1 Tax=Actinoalloteichus fjordicus TaxID=1612552 RepID=A0AAC9PTN6_9PSEU|nr:hypothetical protein UA74_20975 [Actinoalloteichus fjordicus]APU22280.1 hypothetical protein UA75_21455 [Actinoalloteichus sp. GBA129-24]